VQSSFEILVSGERLPAGPGVQLPIVVTTVIDNARRCDGGVDIASSTPSTTTTTTTASRAAITDLSRVRLPDPSGAEDAPRKKKLRDTQ
jgi:hypothetical protein